MAENVFLRSPVDMALAEGEAELRPAASGATTGSPKPPRLSIEDASASYKVPANLIQALGEAGGLTEEQIGEAAPRLAEALAGPLGAGRKHSEAIRAILPGAPEGFERQVVERSNALYDEIYAPPAQPAAAAPSAEDGGLGVADAAVRTAAGVNSFLGSAVRGAGEIAATLGDYTTTPLAEAITGQEFGPTPNALAPAADAIEDFADQGRGAISAEGKQAILDSSPKGDLFKPSTWEFGDAPSLRGYALLGADVLGSMLPVVAAGLATGGVAAPALVGGIGGGGAGGETAAQMVDQMAAEKGPDGRSRLETESAYYREAVAAGASPEQALATTREAAARLGFWMTLPVSTLGGAATGAIASPASRIATGGGIISRILGRGAVSGAEEGAQEVGETVAARTGGNLGAGTDESVTEGTFGDFILGAIGGAGPGAVAGGFSRRDAAADEGAPPEPEPEDAAPEMLALPAPALITPPPPREDPAAGPLSAALQAAPARVAPDLNPGDRITLEPEGVSPIGAVVLGEAPGGLRVRDDDGQELEIPREEIEAGTTRIIPAGDAMEGGAETAQGIAPGAQDVPLDAMDAAATPQDVVAPEAVLESPAPMLDAPEAAIAPGGLAETAGQAVQPPAPQPEPEAPADPLEAARARLAFIEDQGRSNGWNGRLAKERKALREQIAALEPAAPAAEPLSEPLNSGPAAAPAPAKAAPEVSAPPTQAVAPTPAETEQPPAGATVAPTISQIREKAGLVTGIDQAAADKIAADLNIKFAPDKKSGGFTFSWKHADRVRAAVGGEAEKPAVDTADSRIAARNAMLPKGYKLDFDGGGKNLHLFGPDGQIASALAAGFRTMSPQQQAAVLTKAQSIATNRAHTKADERAAPAPEPERRPSPPQIEPLAGMSPMGKRTVIAPVDKDGAPTGPKVVINRLTRAEMEAELVASDRAREADAIRKGEVPVTDDRERQRRENVAKLEEIATAAAEANPDPTDAQKEAGNYKMGHTRVQGLDITIENAKGSTRSGKGADGTEWSVEMPAHYGYIKRTEGADGDHVDVYLGESPESDKVWIIDQVDAETKAFDEHKVMIGFPSASEAEITYLEGFSDGKGRARMGAVTFMTMAEFKAAVSDKAQWSNGPLARINARQEKPKAKLGAAPVLDENLKSTPKPTAADVRKAALETGAPPVEDDRERQRRENVAKLEKIKAEESEKPAYGAGNKLVSADRAAELRERLKAKLRDQLSAGIDPEILAIGAELMVFHVEAGARRFADAAKAIAGDLGTTPDKIKPYLRAWYNGARDMLEDSDQSIDGMDGPDAVRAALAEIGKAPEPAAAPAPAAGERPSLFVALTDRLAKGEGFASISEARKFAAEITGEKVEAGTMAAKTLDETIEAAVVEVADMIAREGRADPLATYRKMVALYAAQPRLGVRTSDSIARQAYSTPAPLAYLASRLAGVGPETVVFEPSAGNGMLLIGANRDRALVNEIDPERAKALIDAGFSRVLQQDATEVDAAKVNGRPVDAVIANPPFGPVKGANGQNKVFEVSPEYSTREIDHAISFKALDAMKDDGRAVLLIAGLDKTITDPEKRSDAYNTKAKREFYLWLKRHYRVADHFTVAGELYEKQGAGWPIDVIVIEGRGEGSRPVPAVNLPKLYSSWEALEEKLGGDNAADRSPAQPSDRAGGDARAPKRVDRDPVRDDGGARPAPVVRPGRDGGDAVRQPGDGAAPGDAGDAGRSVPEPGPDVRSERPAGRAAPVGAKAGKAAASGETQVPYKPASGGKSVDTLVPVNMAEDVAQALAAIKAEHGDIDAFVAKELGYPKKELASRFSAEQVDALAMALVNIRKNAGFVIGDQTGIGKGRVVAGMIRYALKKGYKPIFVTEKPNLYADMWRDMTDIGIPEMLGRAPVVLPTNAGLSMALDEDGAHKIKTGTTAAHDAYMRENADKADMIFTTYSQMQTQAGGSPERRQIIQSQIPNAVLIFDESHNAGGQGPKRGFNGEIDNSAPTGPMNRAEFARAIAQQARAVMFSSATYAKRPEVMDLYAKTDMILAVDNPAMLGEAIAKGGIPMQQVVASMLSRAGQYLRRERSFKGIDYKTVDVEVDRAVYDNASRILDAIRLFSKEVQAAAKSMDKEMKADGKAVSGNSSTGGAGVDSTNFTSVMHNLIDAMLLAVNAKPAADRAIAHLKAGRKPVLTVNFTMGALLQEYVSDNGLAAGAPIDLTFNRLFDRYLEKSRWVSERKPFMKKGEKAEKKYLTDAQLGPAGLAAFARAKAMIEEANFADYPVSPIDYMRDRITKAGFKVAEITGRSAAIDYSGPKMTLTSVPSEEQGAKGRTTSVRGFNNGGIDALILNQAGSTGLSLHASEKAKDQRPRTMLIVQAASNIDTHMQMLGRVNRTGQVVLPEYEQLAPNIPATIRPAAVLAKKMASLNANTTASRKSALSDDSIDVLNTVGDKAVMELMNDEPGLNARLGEPVKAKDKSEDGQDVADDIARRVTGRIPLLPVDEQERIYSEIFRRYRQKIAEAESRGENPLEAQTLDADAVLIEETIIAPKGGPSPFQDAVHKATYDINSPVRPIDVAKLTESMAEDAEIDLPDGTDEEKLAAIRRAFNSAPFEEAWEAHRRWTQEQIEAAASEEQAEDFRSRQREISGHFRAVMNMVERDARPGSAVELIDMVNGFTLPAIVTRARRAGRTLNPLAGSAWEINIQVAGIGAMTIPFSQVATSVKDGQYAFRAGSETKILGLIRDSAKARREKRIILTGNLLTAYEIAGGRGSIVNFTTREGELKQGLMLRKDQDLENVSGGFRSGAHVIEYVAKAGNIASTDAAITIAARGDAFRFEIAASKAKGGKYFLNAGVQEAAGAPFVSVGGNMRLDVEKDRAVRMVENMRRAGASFVGTDPEIAREVGGEAAAPKKGLFAPGESRTRSSVAASNGRSFASTKDLRDHIVAIPGMGEAIAVLIDSGFIKLFDTPPAGESPQAAGSTYTAASAAPGAPRSVLGVALYAANLRPETAAGVVLHEMFHAGGEAIVGVPAWNALLARVETMRAAQQAKATEKDHPAFEDAEEFAAYNLQHYHEDMPKGVRAVVDRLAGVVKAFLLRKFGRQIGRVTRPQLRALAAAALRDQARRKAAPGAGGRARHSVDAPSIPAVTPKQMETMERGLIGNALTKAMEGGRDGQISILGLVPGRPLFGELAKRMPQAQEYLDLKTKMSALRNQWHARMDATAQDWRKLVGQDSAANKRLMDLMHESTLAGIDPSKPFQADPDPRKRAAEEVRRVEHGKLRMRFNALPPAFRAMFGKVRDEYKALNAEFDATLLANVERSIEVGLRAAERDHEAAMERIRDDGLKGRERADAIAEADGRLASAKYRHRANRRARMADLRAEFETRTVPEPYFPLARFGSFFVTSRDIEGKVIGFSTFESPKAQMAFAKEQIAAGHKVDVGTLGETPVRGMVDPAFVQSVENILVDANVPDAVLDAVWQRWLHTMPDLSLRKSRIHRKGTPGFSSDALRAFGHHMFHGAHQLARLKYAILMDEALTLAEGQARMQADPVRSSLVIREMRRRHDYAMNPKGAWWSQMATSAAFVYYLAMSPATAAVNLSQTVIVGVPILAAGVPKSGVAGAARELGRALRDFTRGKGHAAESDRLSPDEKEAMEEAYRRGTIDKSQAHDLAGVGETGVEYSPVRTKVMAVISWAFHHTERLNREVTFLAAYRMARGDGMGHHDAMDKAAELTWRTHFDYQNDSRPRIMQGDAARVLLVFRNFTFNMLFRLVRDVHQSINAADPAERREAITQLAGVTGMLFLNAGVRGVWGYGLAIMLIGLFFGGGSDEVEDEIKKAVVSTLGKNLGGMVLNGVPGHLTGTDLTSRIGMADLWFRSPDRILEGEDAYNYWLGEFLGAGFGMVERAYIGASMMMDGEWQRGLETLAPKSVRDILRSGRFATEGVTTMKGDSIIDDLPSLDVARQALGFTPAVLAERYDANRKLKNAEQRIMDERSTAMAAYANAIRRGEPTGDALRRVQEFNRANPTYPITGESMRTSIRSRARASSRISGGIILNPRLDQVLREDAPPMVYE